MKELIRRFRAETPKFWKKFRNLVWILASAAAGIWAVNYSFSLELPQQVLEVLKYVIAGGGAMGFQAQLTEVNNSVK